MPSSSGPSGRPWRTCRPRARRDLPTRDAVVGQLADIVLGDVLEALLGDPAGPRARERLTRGWEAAVGQPRYGPATAAIGELLERLRALDRGGGPRPGRDAAREERLGPPPWPRATSPEEDDALRVSSELRIATRPRRSMRSERVGERHAAPARRAAARVAHLLVLRHAFPAREFERHAAPWLGTLIPRAAPWGARVGRRPAERLTGRPRSADRRAPALCDARPVDPWIVISLGLTLVAIVVGGHRASATAAP